MASHNKFFISDHHFFHNNILKFVDAQGHRIRGIFPTVEEHGLSAMHEYMIEKHNSVVGDNDYVYFGGDVTFQYHAAFNNLMSRLKGKKRLIVGNHDKIWNPALMQWFEKVDLWKGFKEHNFTFTHIPLMLGSLRDGAFNVHGHTHQNKLADPHYINVCVETRNYTPVSIEEIGAEIAKVR